MGDFWFCSAELAAIISRRPTCAWAVTEPDNSASAPVFGPFVLRSATCSILQANVTSQTKTGWSSTSTTLTCSGETGRLSSRAAYKLIELDPKDRLLRSGA